MESSASSTFHILSTKGCLRMPGKFQLGQTGACTGSFTLWFYTIGLFGLPAVANCHPRSSKKMQQGQKGSRHSLSIVDSSEGWRAFEGTAESRRDPSLFFSKVLKATQEEGTWACKVASYVLSHQEENLQRGMQEERSDNQWQWDCEMVWRRVRRQRWWGSKWKQSDKKCFSIEILRTTCTISYRCTRMSCTQEVCIEVRGPFVSLVFSARLVICFCYLLLLCVWCFMLVIYCTP